MGQGAQDCRLALGCWLYLLVEPEYSGVVIMDLLYYFLVIATLEHCKVDMLDGQFLVLHLEDVGVDKVVND